MYTLDTNSIIYYLKAEGDVASHFAKIFAEAAPIYISTVTELELFAFSNLSQRSDLVRLTEVKGNGRCGITLDIEVFSSTIEVAN